MRIIVTRPAAQAAVWVDELQRLGVQAQALPLIGIEPAADIAAVRAAWASLPALALVMFVSANAVQHFFAERPPGVPWPEALIAGSTGPGTSAALRSAGVSLIEEPAAETAEFDSEALWARLRLRSWAGRRVLVVRGEGGRDWLSQRLREHGAEVEFLSAYRRVAPVLDEPARRLLTVALAEPAQHLWLFSSSEAVSQLLLLAPQGDWSAAHAWVSHERIAQAARAAGFGRVERVLPDPQAVAQRLLNG